MAIGTVKWFNNAKGYGFILPDGGGEDLFAHYSSIQMDGYKTLKAGQAVDFEIIEGPKGLQATNIQAAGSADDAEVSETEVSEAEQSVSEADESVSEAEQSASGAETSEADASKGEEPETSEVLSVTVEDAPPADEVDGNRIEPSQVSHSS